MFGVGMAKSPCDNKQEGGKSSWHVGKYLGYYINGIFQGSL